MAVCQQCGVSNADSAKFCSECGNSLARLPVAPPPIPDETEARFQAWQAANSRKSPANRFLAILALIVAIIIGVFVLSSIGDDERSREAGADYNRREAESHERYVKQQKVEADAYAAKIAAEREAQIKVVMKLYPSWTRGEAEKHVLAQEQGSSARIGSDAAAARSLENITRGCGIVHGATASKGIGSLTVTEAQQIQACDAAGLYH